MSGIIRIEIDMNSIEDMMPGYGDGDHRTVEKPDRVSVRIV